MHIPEEQWVYGPDLDIYCYFRQPALDTWNADGKTAILGALAIEEIEDIGWSNTEIDGTKLPLSCGLWRLAEGSVGVKIIPSVTEIGHELLLAIPPREARRWLGHFPWVFAKGWATERVVAGHRELIGKCRVLSLAHELRAIMIQEETWLFSVPMEVRDICLHPKLATAMGLEGKQHGEVFMVP